MELNQNSGTTGSTSSQQLSYNLVPPPSRGRSPAPAQQFLTSAAFQMLREFSLGHSLEAPGSSRKRQGRGIIHQHFQESFGLLFLLQREVLRWGSTHLPQVRKKRGRPISLGSRLPTGFSPRFNSRKCFRKYWNSREAFGSDTCMFHGLSDTSTGWKQAFLFKHRWNKKQR